MARKTVADLEAENAELKVQLSSVSVVSELEAENKALIEQVSISAEAKAAAESRLAETINNMEEMTIIDGQVQAEGVKVFYGSEYTEYLEAKGIKKQGKLSIEMLRVSINSDWTPKMVMREFGLTQTALQQVVWRLSERELRSNPIKLDFVRDLFGKAG